MILTSLFFLLCWSCSKPETIEDNSYYLSKTFSQEYEEVWNALEHLMVDKMMLPVTTKDKGRGIIESDWVSVIRLRGTMRWKVKILLDKRESGTTVRVSHVAEVPTEVVGKMKDKKGDIKTGWQTSEENIREVDNLLPQLEQDLGD
jgi:hypothetical protein